MFTSSGKHAAQTASLEAAKGRTTRNQPSEVLRTARPTPGISTCCKECRLHCLGYLSSCRGLLTECWVCRLALQNLQDPDGWQQHCLGMNIACACASGLAVL